MKYIENPKLELGRKEWPGEWCNRCNRRNMAGFIVPDELWNKVVGDPDVVRCFTCFDEEAQEKGIRYSGLDVKDVFPVSWSDWDEDVVFETNHQRAIQHMSPTELAGFDDAEEAKNGS